MKSPDHQSLEEQFRLVSRYVAGDLSRSERAEFEAWLVASPELAAEVEMERRLRRGIASAARRGWLRRGVLRPAAHHHRWHVALAASVLVALAIGVSMKLPRGGVEGVADSHTRLEPERILLAARTVRLGSVRGVSTSPDIIVARNESPSSLTIEPDVVTLTCEDGSIELECPGGAPAQTPQYPEYEMELVKRGGGSVAWRSSSQLASARSPLSFTIADPGSLGVADYDLVVRGRSAEHEEVVARFWLRID